MRFGEKVVVFILRPIYRTFFERLLWWFLARIKIFFLAEIGVQLSNLGSQVSECLRKLENIESGHQQRYAAIEERLRVAESNNAAQWDAMEQLLLAMFRQPEPCASDVEREPTAPQQIPIANGTDLNRVHAASSIR